jgi:hypothetical protein
MKSNLPARNSKIGRKNRRANKESQRPISRKVDRNLMAKFTAQCEQPEQVETAVKRCMLLAVQLRTHDPLLLQAITGYSLKFVATTIWCLLQNERWTGWGGDAGLICSLDHLPDVDPVLDELQEIFEATWRGNCWEQVEAAWWETYRCAITNPFVAAL